MERNRIQLTDYTLYFVLAVIVLIGSVFSDSFFTAGNLMNVIRVMTLVLIIAFGEMLVIISGGIDLSPGAVLALAGMVSGIVLQSTGLVIVAAAAGAATGAAVGVFGALFINRFRLPPFIVTLATMQIARGLAYLVTDRRPIYNLDERFVFVGQGSLLGVAFPIWIAVFLLFLTWFVMALTRTGRHIYAIGGNELSARTSGVNVERVKLFVYGYAGMLSGIVGIILAARLRSAQPNVGFGYEFLAITGVIVGGTSFTGGVGSIWGTLIGVLIIGFITNILNLLNVNPYYQSLVKGAIILLAVIIDYQMKRKRR